MRPLLIGEAPSRGGDRYHAFPLSGRPARVLCELAGIPPEPDGSTYGRWTWALYDRFECVNVIERYADATPWSAPRARDAAALLATDGRVVVCLGRRVQAAVLGRADVAFHEWVGDVVAVPHPSGLNRVLNEQAARAATAASLLAALARA